MSAVRDYYKDHHSAFDDLHRLLDREPALLGQLPALRARALSCCGAAPSKNGEVRLVVSDPATWDRIAAEQAAIQEKLDAIDGMVAKLDGIFAEMEQAGIETQERTIRGIWAAEACRRTPVIDPHTLTNVDRLGHRIPQKRDPQLVAWGERANAALREAQAIVG